MKHINTLALAAMVAAGVSCTHFSPEFSFNNSIQSGQKMTITASCGDPETRTERASDGAVLWSPGDQISLFYGSGDNGGSCFTGQNTEPSKVVNFTGEIGVITGGNDVAVEDTYFWAVYPYNPIASCDGSSITTTLPSAQVAVPDTFADDLFPSVGRSQGLVMGFYNICGGLKITISEEGIKSVTLQGHNNEPLAGTLTVGFDDSGQPTVTGIADGSDAITVSAPQGETFEVGKSYYIVFVPTVFENGFTLTFSKGYARAVYDRTKKTTIRRSTFGGLTTPDKDLEWEIIGVPIPDANFKAYMIRNFDSNGNGELDFDEAEAVTEITVSTNGIVSLQGIEYCPNLKSLICPGSGSAWDGNSFISKGGLTVLDISKNTALETLKCFGNQLSNLNVSNNVVLKELRCYGNLLTSLDVSNNSDLTNLYCTYNQITSLDVSNNTALSILSCAYNQISSLDISQNTSLTLLYCYHNLFTSLDVSHNPLLEDLRCYSNQLASLDVSQNKALSELRCNDNLISGLDISMNIALTSLNCGNNLINSLNVSHNTSLTSLFCNGNQLSSLDVSQNTALTYLYCSNNLLTSLDLSNNTGLTHLECGNNQIKSLDVSKLINLSGLICSPMNSIDGQNLLGYLYIAQGQSIPNVTVNRDSNNVPAETIIMIAPEPGGNEGTVDDELD